MLSESERDQYAADGFVVVPGLLDHDEVDRIDAEIDAMLPGLDDDHAPAGWIFALHRQKSDVCSELARDERIVTLVEQVVAPGVSLHSSKLVAKLPHSTDVCHWHQDEAFYSDTTDREMLSDVRMSIWIPLQDTRIDNGCLWVVPASHRAGIESHHEVGTGHCRRKIIRSDYADEHAAPLLMAAGDAVLFSAYLWHHSKGNETEQVRRAFIASYQEAAVPRDAYGNDADVLRPATASAR